MCLTSLIYSFNYSICFIQVFSQNRFLKFLYMFSNESPCLSAKNLVLLFSCSISLFNSSIVSPDDPIASAKVLRGTKAFCLSGDCVLFNSIDFLIAITSFFVILDCFNCFDNFGYLVLFEGFIKTMYTRKSTFVRSASIR